MTLWGSRLIVMVANILGGGRGKHGWALKPWVLEIQAMVQIHCMQPFIECRSSGRRKISNS